jgi:hypothetical protein
MRKREREVEEEQNKKKQREKPRNAGTKRDVEVDLGWEESEEVEKAAETTEYLR